MAIPEHIPGLIFKYLENTITFEEEAALLLWVNESGNNKEIFDNLINGDLLKTLSESGQSDKENEWEKLEKKYFKTRSVPKRPLSPYYVGIICFVFICIGIYWGINKSRSGKNIKSNRYISKGDPAMHGVILTLADGSHVNIDTAKGQIKQYNAVIIKNGNQIYYESATNNRIRVEYNSIQTNSGRKFQVSLPDGSKVWLNAASNMRYPTAFGNSDRKVQVTGEAYFEINTTYDTNNNKIPFKVETSGIEINVLGTHFNINSYPNEMMVKTTLLEGRIEIRTEKSSFLLSPGQQAQINSLGKVNILRHIEIDEVMAWKNDLFIFNDLPIESAMKEIARWYGFDVIYEDYIIKRITSTIPRHMSLPGVLEMLATTTGLHFNLKDNQIIIQK